MLLPDNPVSCHDILAKNPHFRVILGIECTISVWYDGRVEHMIGAVDKHTKCEFTQV